nr:hypothetical protein [Ilumatobacter fluminis]
MQWGAVGGVALPIDPRFGIGSNRVDDVVDGVVVEFDDLSVTGRDHPGLFERFTPRREISDDVRHDLRSPGWFPLGEMSASVAGHRDHRVIATLPIGARQRELVGTITVFGTTSVDIGTELFVDEQFEDRHELIGHQRVTTTHPHVEGATDHMDVSDAFVDVTNQVGERTVLVGELHEIVDPAFQFEMRVMLGELEIDRCDLDEVVTSSRVGMDPGDLDDLVDTDPTGEQRITERRYKITHLGHPAALRRCAFRQVLRRSQIRDHCALPVEPVGAARRGHRQQCGVFGGESPLFEFVGSDSGIELGIGQREVVLDELGEHDPMVPNMRFVSNR